MSDRIQSAADDLRRIAADAEVSFGALSAEQLSWKPAPKSWSVAQCLDHLIQTHQLYLPLFQRLAAGEASPSVWERISPFSGFFGRFLIRTVDPATPKKVKTFGKAEPSASEFDGRIVERFIAHQADLAAHVCALPTDLYLDTIVTSPLFGLVTYSFDDCLDILVFHCRRHLDQARRVMEAGGFPA